MAYADYSAQILVNGVSIFDSFASVSTGSADPSAPSSETAPNTSTSGTVLSPGNVDVDSSSYAWGLFTDTIDLGVINPFEVINIEYTVKSTASGLEDDRFFFFLNDGEVPEFGTRTFFNDPTGFTFSTPLANPPTEASAPAGLLLSLLGLGGILVLRRKK